MISPVITRIAKYFGFNTRITDYEIAFLRLIEGKRANDKTTLGWWCAFNNIDRDKTIKKLCKYGYIMLSDYKYNVGKSTIPVLKKALSAHHLSAKGKKAELVQRVLDNISETDCSRLFTQFYYVHTQKALGVIRESNMKAEQEYNERIGLIRCGAYDKLQARLYPNQKEHWGTEDTFLDTLDFVMRHGFEGFGLREDIRKNASAFVALRAVDYSSRDYSTYKDDTISYFRSLGTDYKALKLPDSLLNYAEENEIGDYDDIYDIYCQFVINSSRAIAELNNYKRLGFKKIKIDTVSCHECGRSKNRKTYSINRAPVLPTSWNCTCAYTVGD